MAPFFDSHAHLQEPEFAGDVDEVLARAREAGVDTVLVPGVDLETSRAAVGLAEAHAGVFASAGYHPHEASRLDEAALSDIEALVDRAAIVAVGEIGLDYYRMHSSREAQLDAFAKMLDLAARHYLPAVVHCRDAWDDMASILDGWSSKVRAAYEERPLGVMHYFTGTLEQARRYIELGFLISVHTSVTQPKAAALREAVASLPLEALLIETDSPYGAPQSARGKRNEPAYVIEAAKQIAALHGISLEAVAEATSANARGLLRLPVVSAAGGGPQ